MGASLTSTCCQNLWLSFLDQVYGSPPRPLLHSFIKCLLRACCIWVPSSMLPVRDKDCRVCGVRQSAVTLNARARCCAEGGGRRMGAQVHVEEGPAGTEAKASQEAARGAGRAQGPRRPALQACVLLPPPPSVMSSFFSF